jgi:ABC-type cobalamin/Fe3+-siderophores transport system ATPase subunit
MAVLAVNGSIDPLHYAAIVERTEELARLQAQAQRRKSMLIFGPEAVGKTRLLRTFVETQSLTLFAAEVRSRR